MKALEILLEMQYAIDTTGVDDMIGLNEAIEELEELQDKYNIQQEFIKKFMTDDFENRSCDGCKHYEYKVFVQASHMITPDCCIGCIRLGIFDRWESKE